MDITPQDVVDVMNAGGIKNWVLMGLHGYVGYMPSPRATQDVDVMVPYGERNRAKKAIAVRWPELIVRELSQVTRFLDPLDLDAEGKPKPAVDVMFPWGSFQELILDKYVLVDAETQHRIPTLEAALVSKYAAILSPYRDREKKDYDAGDFRRLVRGTAIGSASRTCIGWRVWFGKAVLKRSTALSKSLYRMGRFRFRRSRRMPGAGSTISGRKLPGSTETNSRPQAT